MGNKAFVDNDGDYCIMVQEGRLDIQTEFGRLMVHPGEVSRATFGPKSAN